MTMDDEMTAMIALSNLIRLTLPKSLNGTYEPSGIPMLGEGMAMLTRYGLMTWVGPGYLFPEEVDSFLASHLT